MKCHYYKNIGIGNICNEGQYCRNIRFIFKIVAIKWRNVFYYIDVILTVCKHTKVWAIFYVNIVNIDQDIDNTRVNNNNKITRNK